MSTGNYVTAMHTAVWVGIRCVDIQSPHPLVRKGSPQAFSAVVSHDPWGSGFCPPPSCATATGVSP